MQFSASTWPRAGGHMAARIRAFEWERTPLGPIANWQQSLRTGVELMLTSGFPSALYLGAAGTHLYNDRWADLLGDSGTRNLGHAYLSERRDRVPAWVERLQRARTGETSTEEHAPLPSAEDVADTRRFSVSYSPLYSEGGEVQGVSVLTVETSEIALRAQLRAAIAARQKAERADRVKDDFLATASHELRTPLASILLWVQALRKGGLPAHDIGRALDAIAESAESQSRLLEDLLDLSRFKSGKVKLESQPTSIEALARAAMQVFGPAATEKHIQLDVELAPAGHLMLDPGRFQQALWNLLANALKFTPAGGHVRLRMRKIDGQLEVEVADTGKGIEPEFLPQLFLRFQQSETGAQPHAAGLGIGLALCRYFVELHGGTITGQSEGLGRGATFTLRIPWVTPEVIREEAPPGAIPESPCSLRGRRILLVEDDVNTRQVMSWILERAGAEVAAVDSGPAALAILINADGTPRTEAQDDPDVVVCDIGLPGMSGYDVIQQLTKYRESRGRSRLPACAVSAHAREVDRRRAIDAGFDVHLAKPVTAEQLIETVALLAEM